MSPYRPDVLKFQKADKKYEIHLPRRDKDPTLVEVNFLINTKVTWPKDIQLHPQSVASTADLSHIFFIGGLGDPGSSLGEIKIYDKSGALLKAINLKDQIPDLEKIALAYGMRGNFPWVSALDMDAKSLRIWVCEKILVELKFEDFSVKSSPSARPKWVEGKEPDHSIYTKSALKFIWKDISK